jgi:hypothetical protein
MFRYNKKKNRQYKEGDFEKGKYFARYLKNDLDANGYNKEVWLSKKEFKEYQDRFVLNPATGKRWQYGEQREDGKFFRTYRIGKVLSKTGKFQSIFVSESTLTTASKNQSKYKQRNKRKDTGKRRINPSTGKYWEKGDIREDGAKLYQEMQQAVDVEGYRKLVFLSEEEWLKKHIATTRHRRIRKDLEQKWEIADDVTTDYLYKIFPKDGICPIFGTKMEFGGDKKTSPSLDRVDPTKGYVRGNIAWISDRANTIKTDANSEQILKVGKWLKKMEKKIER